MIFVSLEKYESQSKKIFSQDQFLGRLQQCAQTD